MSGGIFSVSRDIFDHPIVGRDPVRFKAWLQMVAKACWKPTKFDVKGKTITLDRGQFVASYRQLADELGWSLGATQRFLTRLKTDTMIETVTDTGKMVITICNYELYQLSPAETDTPTDTPTDTELIQNRYTKEEGNKVKKREVKREADASPKKATRLPDDWLLPKLWGEWAVAQGLPPERVRREALKFRNYWTAKAGKDAAKRNWEGTWQNWCLKALDDTKPKRTNGDDRTSRTDNLMRLADGIDQRTGADQEVDHGAGSGSPESFLPTRHIG